MSTKGKVIVFGALVAMSLPACGGGGANEFVIGAVNPLTDQPMANAWLDVQCQSYAGRLHGSRTAWRRRYRFEADAQVKIPRTDVSECDYVIATPGAEGFVAGKRVFSRWSNPSRARLPEQVYLLPQLPALRLTVLKSYARGRGLEFGKAEAWALEALKTSPKRLSSNATSEFHELLNLIGSFSAVGTRAYEAFGPAFVDEFYCKEIDRLMGHMNARQRRDVVGGYGEKVIYQQCDRARKTRGADGKL